MKDAESERLKYRPLNEADISLWMKFLDDPISTKYFPKLPLSVEERAQSWIKSQLLRYNEGSYGMTAIIRKKDNTFVGQCGLLKQEVDGIPEVEVGYHLFRQFCGMGYATEASRHFKEYAFKQNLADSIISIIHEHNLPSQAVAKRNGMSVDKRTVWKDMNVIIFRAFA
ncbi:MAG: GNAT family N-acetyltransferase [Crocinitomicaceae bacterium]|nr:GNAT family N-acetyltransferase [Crocinitomicaceae bacterium]